MFALSSLFPTSVPRFLTGRGARNIDIEPVAVHDVETRPEKRARTLKHLIKLNHANHSILFHNMRYHNHMPHLLGSAFILGANEGDLEEIYEAESQTLEKWQDSPGEVSKHDWREHLGDRQYQRAYVDFFEDEMAAYGYDWRKVLDEYLFKGDKPLFNNIFAGLGHPLIHLGYAYELSSREIAMEALGLATTCYDYLHKYLDDPQYSKPTSLPKDTPLGLLSCIAADSRLDKLFRGGKKPSMEELFRDHEDLMMEYWNAWNIKEPRKQFEDSQFAAMLLLAGTQPAAGESFSFFLVHTLTSSHAVRIVLPNIPSQFEIPLVRQWWLFVLAVYITQGRPEIKEENVAKVDVGEATWQTLHKKAVNGGYATDAHYVKAIRALEVAASTWGDEKGLYFKAAVKFASQFEGWTHVLEEVC